MSQKGGCQFCNFKPFNRRHRNITRHAENTLQSPLTLFYVNLFKKKCGRINGNAVKLRVRTIHYKWKTVTFRLNNPNMNKNITSIK